MFLSGLKKEIKLFSRGFRFWGIIIAMIGFAVVYPGIYKMMESMVEMMNNLGVEAGADMGDAAASLKQTMDSLVAIYGGEMAYVGFYTGILGLTTEGFLVISLLLMMAAGGEQKKRSVIMPNCAGLTPAGYILPKFALYPIAITVINFFGVVLNALVSQAMFGVAIPVNTVIFSGVCISMFVFFAVSAYLFFGIATGRPGIGVVVMYLSISLFPTILASVGVNKYNPFALRDMFITPVEQVDMNNFWLSLVVTVILSVIFCLLSLAITTARKIENSVGEANL